MGIRIGVIDYERPSRPVNVEEVRKYLTIAGKDVIRLAWASLNTYDDNRVKHDALAVWFCEFFNMKHDEGNGSKCIQMLKSMDLLEGIYNMKPKVDV